MKVAKLVKIDMEMLKLLSSFGVRIDDWQYVEAYEDFLNMRDNHVKYRAAIKMLSDDLKVSERTLERVFKRLSQVVN